MAQSQQMADCHCCANKLLPAAHMNNLVCTWLFFCEGTKAQRNPEGLIPWTKFCKVSHSLISLIYPADNDFIYIQNQETQRAT